MDEQTQTPSSTLNFVDELDCGSFFDQMDDLLDFTSDEDAETKNYEDVNNSLKPTSSILANHGGGGSDNLSVGLYVPYDDIVQLEFLSSSGKDSGFLTMNNKSKEDLRQLRTSSPVHDSLGDHQKAAASPCSAEDVGSRKRGRPPCKKVCPCCYTNYPSYKPRQMQRKLEQQNKKKKRWMEVTTNEAEPLQQSEQKKKRGVELRRKAAESVQQAVRKCVHCQVTKTPQWRAGPAGLNTLCNACGLRFLKGSLFPEYRPAKSPTFVSSLHTNFLKEVLAMRSNTNATTNDGDLPETLISTECSLTRSPESQQQS
ncbi:GATA transcription factor 11 [Linum grandiflorum]